MRFETQSIKYLAMGVTLAAGLTLATAGVCEGQTEGADAGSNYAAPPSSASLSPSMSFVAVGETCTLSVRIDSSGDSLACSESWVSFDTSMVEIVTAEEGSLFQMSPYPRFFLWVPIAPDTHSVEGCLLGYRTCAVGPGEIARYVFRARQEGTCPVRITRLNLMDINRVNWFQPVTDPNAWIVIGTATGIRPACYQDLRLECRPNPFAVSTTVTVTLVRSAESSARTPVCVRIYTADGRLVKTLFEGRPGDCETNFVWDGTNANGEGVTSGVYFAAARTDASVTWAKVVLLR